MTPKHRSIVREGWQAIGQKGSASNANPFSKTGIVAGLLQDWIAQNHPVEAAELRLENNPDGLTMDAQCVLDGTLNPEEANDEVFQNFFQYNAKYAKHRISQEKAAFDQRVANGEVSTDEMLTLQINGDPRGDELQAQRDAKRAAEKQDQATVEASLRMQSSELARNQMKAEAMQSGRLF